MDCAGLRSLISTEMDDERRVVVQDPNDPTKVISVTGVRFVENCFVLITPLARADALDD